jgi:hypothetical protein
MQLERYVRRMGRRAARLAAMGGDGTIAEVHAEMCAQVAAAHGFRLDPAEARAVCALLTPPLFQALGADRDTAPEDVADGGVIAGYDRFRARAFCIASVTHALAHALQAWLCSIGFVEVRPWRSK